MRHLAPGQLAGAGLAALLLATAPGCVCVGLTCGDDDDLSLPPAPDDDDATGDDDDSVGLDGTRSCGVVVEERLDWTPGSVEIAGEFNDWTPQAMTLDGETWTADLGELAPGSYGYKFLYDGSWEGAPPASAYAKWVDGTENRALYVGDCSQPLLRAVSASASPDGRVEARLHFAKAADGSPLDLSSIVVEVGLEATNEDDGAVDVTVTPDEGRIDVTVNGLAPGKHTLRAWASDEAGRPSEEPVFVPLWVEETPFAWEDGLIYFAFVDRFRNGDFGEEGSASPVADTAEIANYMGGDFLGILDAMDEDYFEQLGANILWLTPVYENPDGPYLATDGVSNFSGFHGYWPTDPFAVEEKLGDVWVDSEDRLNELITEAHARGIRVLFDLVLNHVHEDHVYRQQHPEWFGGGCVCGTAGCGWEENPVGCWFTPYLPDLDYTNHWVLERVVEDTLELVRRFDVDAVRVDAAKHMQHVIMRTLKKRLTDDIAAVGGASVYMIGETFTGGGGHGQIMEYVSEDELDAQFDFPLFWSIRDTFAGGGTFEGLEGSVATSASVYGDAYPLMSPFIGNHDIPRFATVAAGNEGSPWGGTEDWIAGGGEDITQQELIDRQSMALAFALTQPGVPLLYYGDEIGLAGAGDPDNRRFMSFDPHLSANQRELLERTRAIGQARAGSLALRRGDRTQLWVDADLLVYARSGGGETAVVAMNKAWTPRVATIPTGALGNALDGATLVDATNPDRTVSVGASSFEISLGPWEYAILLEE